GRNSGWPWRRSRWHSWCCLPPACLGCRRRGRGDGRPRRRQETYNPASHASRPAMDQLCIVTTVGTIDKIYFDDKSHYQIGEPQTGRRLDALRVAFAYRVVPSLRKDRLHLADTDRELVRATIEAQEARHVLVTHGTDSMVASAKVLEW